MEKQKKLSHWLFRDLPSKENVEEKLREMGWTPLAIGKNFRLCKTYSVSRPYSTDPTSLGRLIKIIERGEVDPVSGEDYSKKVLVYDEKEYMYKLVKCLE